MSYREMYRRQYRAFRRYGGGYRTMPQAITLAAATAYALASGFDVAPFLTAATIAHS